VAVIRHARAQFGATRLVVCGACFDARTALSAFAADMTIDGPCSWSR
jgi:hypothetical protein